MDDQEFVMRTEAKNCKIRDLPDSEIKLRIYDQCSLVDTYSLDP